MQLYPQVMYAALSELWEQGILSNWDGRSERTHMIQALLTTSHTRLVEATLYHENSSQNAKTAILDTYIQQWKFEEILEYLKTQKENHFYYHFAHYIHQIVEKCSDAYIHEFLELEKYSSQHREDIILSLYKSHRRDFADRLIDKYIATTFQNVFKTFLKIKSGEKLSEESILWELHTLFSQIWEKGNAKKWLSYAEDIVRAMQEQNYTIGCVRNIYIKILAEADKWQYRIFSFHELEDHIQDSFISESKYDEAIAFIELWGWYESHLREVLLKKLMSKYLSEQDARVTIEKLTQNFNLKIQECEEKLKQSSKEQSRSARENRFYDRLELYHFQAEKYAALAIYGLLYEKQDEANDAISNMIEWVDKIRIPGKKDAPQEHINFLAKNSKRTKRLFRERFYELWLLERLPEYGGWSSPMQDPKITREKKQEKRENRKNVMVENRTRGERELENQIVSTKRILAYMRLLNDDNIEDAFKMLEANTSFITYTSDWFSAGQILKKNPKKFLDIFHTCAKNAKDSVYWAEILRWMEYFFIEAIKLWSFDVDSFRKGFISFLTDVSRDRGRNYYRPIPWSVIYNIVHHFIKIGEKETAWKWYNFFRKEVWEWWEWEVVSLKTQDVCMWLFIHGVSYEEWGGVSSSLRESTQQRTHTQEIEYHNTEIELAIVLNNTEKLRFHSEELRKCISTPTQAKKWVQLMTFGTLRTSHIKKDELQWVYSQTHDEWVRWRIIDAMIDAKIPGVESLPEIQSQHTPHRITKYFFQKLISSEVLHQYTEMFLRDERHISFLRRLLSEYQNEFNTVMETLHTLSKRAINELHKTRNNNIEDYATKEAEFYDIWLWKHIFLILREIWVFSPWIFIQAQRVWFDSLKVSKMGRDIKEAKQQFFTNQPISSEIDRELLAEIIYAAYKPANLSLWQVQSLCPSLRDCSKHLDSFFFEKQWYKLNFRNRKNVRLRQKNDILESEVLLKSISSFFQENQYLSNWDTQKLRSSVRVLLEIGRFKMENDLGVEDILVPFIMEDEYMGQLLKCEHTNETDLFTTLWNFQEWLGIYLKDTIEERLREFFFTYYEDICHMLEKFVLSMKTEKRRLVLQEQLKIDIEEYITILDWKEGNVTISDIVQLAAKIIWEVIIHKFKPLKDMQRTFKKDIWKFITEDGGDILQSTGVYRAVMSKNISSFFAKSSAGICTAGDTELFHREDHFHINIIDEEKQLCIGNIQAYVLEQKGKKYLLLRGFNPSVNLLKDVDTWVFCEAILDIWKIFCRDNNLEGVIVSENWSFHALSNRGEIVNYIHRMYASQLRDMPSFNITSKDSIYAGYYI